jgi:hypothetical protein
VIRTVEKIKIERELKNDHFYIISATVFVKLVYIYIINPNNYNFILYKVLSVSLLSACLHTNNIHSSLL